MSSIMRARRALTGRSEGREVIGGSSLELKVAGPSMLGIGCPIVTPSCLRFHRRRRTRTDRAAHPSRESGFVRCPKSDLSLRVEHGVCDREGEPVSRDRARPDQAAPAIIGGVANAVTDGGGAV